MIENICNEEILPDNDSKNLDQIKNIPVKAISPQLMIDIEKSLLVGDMLEKISEVDVNLEEIESSFPSLAKELDIKSQEDCISPKSMSLNQLNKIKYSKCINEDENMETSKTIQLLSDFIELKPCINNKDAGLIDLDQNYTPLSINLPSNPIFKVLEEVKQVIPKVNTNNLKENCPLLFNSLTKYINPFENKISKNIDSIPIKSIKELNDKGFIRLSTKSKNTIDGLIKDDIERLKPTELKLKLIPGDFCSKNKFGLDVGPTISEINSDFKFKSLNISNIKDENLKREVVKLNPDKNSKTVCYNELPPSLLIKLDEKDYIQLSNDELRLLEDTKNFGACYGKQYIKKIEQLKINELPAWVLNQLPKDLKIQSLLKELENIPVPFYKGNEINASDLPPKEILALYSQNKIAMQTETSKDLQSIVDLLSNYQSGVKNNKNLYLDVNTVNPHNHLMKSNSMKNVSSKQQENSKKKQDQPPTKSQFRVDKVRDPPKIDFNKLESNSESCDVEFEEEKLFADQVKNVSKPEFHPMIEKLADNSHKVDIKELPNSIQKNLEENHLINHDKGSTKSGHSKHSITHKRRSITQQENDELNLNLNKEPDSNQSKKSNGRKYDFHAGLIPHSIDSADKIIDKCKDKVDQELLDTLRELPHKEIRLDNLPTKVVKALEQTDALYGSQNQNKTNDGESIHSIRITKSSNPDSVSKNSKESSNGQFNLNDKPIKLNDGYQNTSNKQGDPNEEERKPLINIIHDQEVPDISEFDQLQNKATKVIKIPDEANSLLKMPINMLDQKIEIFDKTGKKLCKIRELTSYLKDKQIGNDLAKQFIPEIELNKYGKVKLDKLPVKTLLELSNNGAIKLSQRYRSVLESLQVQLEESAKGQNSPNKDQNESASWAGSQSKSNQQLINKVNKKGNSTSTNKESSKKNYSRRFSKGEFIPGFKIASTPLIPLHHETEESKEPILDEKREEEPNITKPKLRRKPQPKVISKKDDINLIGNYSKNLNRRRTVASHLEERFEKEVTKDAIQLN